MSLGTEAVCVGLLLCLFSLDFSLDVGQGWCEDGDRRLSISPRFGALSLYSAVRVTL